MFEFTIRAFNLSEKYRTPVVLLADETIGHVREQIALPPQESIEVINRKKPKPGQTDFFGSELVAPMPAVGEGFNIAVTASTHNEKGVRFTQDAAVHRRMVKALNAKIYSHLNDIVETEDYNIEDCDVGIVSFGCTSRAVHESVELAEASGIKVGYVRLKTIWPFPDDVVAKLTERARKIIVPELNLGQIAGEIQRVAGNKVVRLNKIGGGELITPEDILQEIKVAVK